jgi:16S rRNA (cytosine967-C5)-methyltransferase
VVCGDALQPDDWWDGERYDRILVDAPCSAVGVIRRHPDIRFLRRANDIPRLQQTQRALLEALWALLKPGGRMLYSTCSVLHAENEAVVGAFVAAEHTAISVDLRGLLPAGLAEPADHGAYLLPGRHATDGFYYALMERVAD